jgi:hypothetical protein
MPFLLLASVTDKVVEPIVDVATEFIGSAGELGVFALMVLESPASRSRARRSCSSPASASPKAK